MDEQTQWFTRPAVQCPRCYRISYHPDDVREGYCGFCHTWSTDVGVLVEVNPKYL
jgi:hypothetical protein